MFLHDYIGNTPLVTLQRLGAGVRNSISVKLEGNNPAGSVKDRPAYSMIRHAEQRGEIKPGDTLVEATSGNTGIALAMVASAILWLVMNNAPRPRPRRIRVRDDQDRRPRG